MTIPADHRVIAGFIETGSSVLDMGCGTGDLMAYLRTARNARVQGVEINDEAIYKCVEKGLSVVHSDIDSGLANYADGAFDFCILNQTLQQVKRIDYVIDESLRVARRVIVGFPNFAHWRARIMLGLRGRSPVTESLPFRWHDTPNIRFLSIRDFFDYCTRRGLATAGGAYLGPRGPVLVHPNLFAENAIIVIEKQPARN